MLGGIRGGVQGGSVGLPGLLIVLGALASCAPEPDVPIHLGTYQPDPTWQSRERAVASTGRGLAIRRGEVVLVEGTGDRVSGVPGDWGLRVDDARNDVAAVVAEAATAGADVPGLVVLFTTFEDRGAGGAGYFLPIRSETTGTGMEPIDARAAYGAERLEGVVNLKSLDQPLSTSRAELVAHELAHRHAAYLRVVPSSTTAIPVILGRQGAHWHAALHSDASLLDGYAWRDRGGGRFEVEARGERLSALDLYALGLLPAEELPAFFFIADARTEGGAAIPPAAQLAVGTVVVGRRIELTAADVIAAVGPRSPEPRQLRAAVVLVTAPGEALDDPAVLAAADRVEAVRGELEAAWSSATGGRGTLCTRLDGCASEVVDGGASDSGTSDAAAAPPTEGCDCTSVPASRGLFTAALVAAFLIRMSRAKDAKDATRTVREHRRRPSPAD